MRFAFKEAARRAINHGRVSGGIKRDQAGGHAGDDALVETFSRLSALAGLFGQALKLLLLRLKLRDHVLKSLQNKLSFILNCAGMHDGRAPRFADKLAVRTQEATQQPGNANEAEKQRDDKSGQQ